MGKGKSKSGLPALNMSVIGEMKLDKDDLIAVAVSREEQRLLGEQADVDGQVKRLSKDRKEATKNADKAREALVKAATDKHVAALSKALKDAGFEHEVKIDGGTIENSKGEVGYSINIGDRYNRMTAGSSVKLTPAVKKLKAAVTELDEQIVALQGEAIEIRKRISQLGSVERAAKAQLAEQLLSQSEEGKAFLASVDGVKSLPMPKS